MPDPHVNEHRHIPKQSINQLNSFIAIVPSVITKIKATPSPPTLVYNTCLTKS